MQGFGVPSCHLFVPQGCTNSNNILESKSNCSNHRQKTCDQGRWHFKVGGPGMRKLLVCHVLAATCKEPKAVRAP